MNRTNLIIAGVALFVIVFFALSFGLGLTDVCLHKLPYPSDIYDPDSVLMGLYIVVLVSVCLLGVVTIMLFVFSQYEDDGQISWEWFLMHICSALFIICTAFFIALLVVYLNIDTKSAINNTVNELVNSFNFKDLGMPSSMAQDVIDMIKQSLSASFSNIQITNKTSIVAAMSTMLSLSACGSALSIFGVKKLKTL